MLHSCLFLVLVKCRPELFRSKSIVAFYFNYIQNYYSIPSPQQSTYCLVFFISDRRKRDTSGDKGQFTHHSYGHYGHQSNNYAHYGHETYITGTTDENGKIRNQQVNHQQVNVAI